MITHYVVIKTRDSQELEKFVNEKIGEDYEPQGGISIMPHYEEGIGRHFIFYQAMIKRED